MAKMQIMGIEEYALKLSKLGSRSEEVAGKAIYAGANIVADKIKANIQALPVVTEAENAAAYRAGEKSGITKRQRAGLYTAFGITPMNLDEGIYNVKLGFDGYNDVKTRKYKKGQPNQLIARVAESGSAYMDKHPFVRPAVNQTRKAANEAMNSVVDTEMEKIMK